MDTSPDNSVAEHLHAGRLQEAEHECVRMLRSDDPSERATAGNGIAIIELHRAQAATRPERARGHLANGLAHADTAIADGLAAHDDLPVHIGLRTRGLLLAETGDYSKAEASLRAAAGFDRFFKSSSSRGIMPRDEAERVFPARDEEELRVERAISLVWLAQVLERQDKSEEAGGILAEAVAQGGREPRVRDVIRDNYGEGPESPFSPTIHIDDDFLAEITGYPWRPASWPNCRYSSAVIPSPRRPTSSMS